MANPIKEKTPGLFQERSLFVLGMGPVYPRPKRLCLLVFSPCSNSGLAWVNNRCKFLVRWLRIENLLFWLILPKCWPIFCFACSLENFCGFFFQIFLGIWREMAGILVNFQWSPWGSINGGFQRVVRVWSAEQIPAPHLPLPQKLKWNQFTPNILSLPLSYGYLIGTDDLSRLCLHRYFTPNFTFTFAFVILKLINSEIILFRFAFVSMVTSIYHVRGNRYILNSRRFFDVYGMVASILPLFTSILPQFNLRSAGLQLFWPNIF